MMPPSSILENSLQIEIYTERGVLLSPTIIPIGFLSWQVPNNVPNYTAKSGKLQMRFVNYAEETVQVNLVN